MMNVYKRKVLAFDDKRVILNTISTSHYVEKVRWAMDKCQIEYEEEKDITIFGVLFFGRMVPTLKIPRHDISISNSSDILKYIYADMLTRDEEKAKFLEPSAKSKELEAQIDKLGNHLRSYFAYHAFVANKNVETVALKLWGIHETDIPPWQKTILKFTWPLLRKFIIKVLDVTKENSDSGLKKAEEFFDQTDKLLSKNKYLLGTDEPTYIDISFASMASLLAWPDQFGGPKLTPESRISLNDFTLEVQKTMKKFRNSTSGKFVLKMYAEQR